jgi:hypothetical protein
MRVRVVPSDHPRRFLDGGRHHVRARVKSNAQKPTLNNPHHIREQTRISKGKKKKRKGGKDISACAEAAASNSGLTSTRSFFRSHLICGDAPHMTAVEPPLLEGYR